jgi:hypothetical protein
MAEHVLVCILLTSYFSILALFLVSATARFVPGALCSYLQAFFTVTLYRHIRLKFTD